MDLAGVGFHAFLRNAIRMATDVDLMGSVIFRQASDPFSFSTFMNVSLNGVPVVFIFRNDHICSDAIVGSRSVIRDN